MPPASLVTLDASEIPADGLLAWSFIASNGMSGEGHFLNGTYKALELEASRLLETTVVPMLDGSFEVTVTSQGLALFVMLESAIARPLLRQRLRSFGRREPHRIVFKPETALPGGTVPDFRIYDLYIPASRRTDRGHRQGPGRPIQGHTRRSTP